MYVYIMTNRNKTTLYVGVTNNLERRVFKDKNHILKGFTSQYELTKLVYYEVWDGQNEAIEREKYLKRCYRKTKDKLIFNQNPGWNDLADNF